MFNYNLKVNRYNTVLSYGPSLPFRLLCAFFSLILFYYFFLSFFEASYTNSGLIPFSIALVLFLTSVFRDEYVFFISEEKVVIKFGLGPFYRKNEILFGDIEQLELIRFVKGKPGGENVKSSFRFKAQIIFQIKSKNGDTNKIEIIGERKSGGRIERQASLISSLTHLPLYKDGDIKEEAIDFKHLR